MHDSLEVPDTADGTDEYFLYRRMIRSGETGYSRRYRWILLVQVQDFLEVRGTADGINGCLPPLVQVQDSLGVQGTAGGTAGYLPPPVQVPDIWRYRVQRMVQIDAYHHLYMCRIPWRYRIQRMVQLDAYHQLYRCMIPWRYRTQRMVQMDTSCAGAGFPGGTGYS